MKDMNLSENRKKELALYLKLLQKKLIKIHLLKKVTILENLRLNLVLINKAVIGNFLNNQLKNQL
jgi:hypothetical protein